MGSDTMGEQDECWSPPMTKYERPQRRRQSEVGEQL